MNKKVSKKEFSTIKFTDEKEIEKVKSALLNRIKKMKIKKLISKQELIDITPKGKKWREYKQGKLSILISE